MNFAGLSTYLLFHYVPFSMLIIQLKFLLSCFNIIVLKHQAAHQNSWTVQPTYPHNQKQPFFFPPTQKHQVILIPFPSVYSAIQIFFTKFIPLPSLTRVFSFHNDFLNPSIIRYAFCLVIARPVDIIITFSLVYLTIQNSTTNFDLTFLSVGLIVILFYFVAFFRFTRFQIHVVFTSYAFNHQIFRVIVVFERRFNFNDPFSTVLFSIHS